MMGEEQGNELTDVALCYQAMGIELDASPPEIERMYRWMQEQYRRKLDASEEALRQEARQSLELLQEMYERIRGSITYQAAHQQYQKKTSSAGTASAARRPLHHATVQKSFMINCPRCNGWINKGVESCPICKAPVLSLGQKLAQGWLTPKKLACYLLLALVLGALLVAVVDPGRIPALSSLLGAEKEEDIFAPHAK